MNFEWDPAKAAANLRKHGVTFHFARRAFGGRMLERRDGRRDYREERWAGLVQIDGRVYAIVWTARGDNTVRLISARKANERETRKYKSETEPPQAANGAIHS